MNKKDQPMASKINHIHEKFKDKRTDPYYWLQKRDAPEVLRYLEEENKYAQQILKPLDKLKKKLFKEMKSRMSENYDTEPVPYGKYKYYISFVKGKDYAIHKRINKKTLEEEIILDENLLADTCKYCDIDGINMSTNHSILAYSIDNKGREFYDTYFKDLKTGKNLKHFIQEATSDLVWANDNQTVFYVQQDPKTLRSFQVYRFDILTGEKNLIYEEKNLKHRVNLNKTLSGDFIFIGSASIETSEWFYLSADNPKADPRLFSARKEKQKYYVNYGDGVFYILTNKDSAANFKLMQVPVSAKEDLKEYSPETWKEVVPHRKDASIENYEVFEKFIALEVRNKGRQEVEILDKKTGKSHSINFTEEVYSLVIGDNCEYHTDLLRVRYSSFTQPHIAYDYDVVKRKLHFKSQYPIKGEFKSENYVSKREFVEARDGSFVPVSLVYRKDLKISKSTPVLLYGYGSYGASMDPTFDHILFSLLDRGFVYALAHIRGGSELGIKWHKDGKFLKKKNTFYDFIDSAEFLINNSYTSSEHLYIMGGSAGGLLIGAVLNERPDLFKGAVALVPFVDVLTTILDESIPLTTGEYEEWGNPNEKIYYDYIKSYSPYDNVKKTKYPHLLISSGYFDPRVQYWEPAKWAAKLRDYKIDDNLLLLVMNMKTGHFGDTGRFSQLEPYALYFSFLLSLENLTDENL